MRSVIAWKKFRGIEMKVPRLRKPPSPDPWFPTDDEVRTILKSIERTEDPSTLWRDKVLMELLFFTGARASEILRIAMDDIRNEGVFIRSSKGEKPRFLSILTRFFFRTVYVDSSDADIITDFNTIASFYKEPDKEKALSFIFSFITELLRPKNIINDNPIVRILKANFIIDAVDGKIIKNEYSTKALQNILLPEVAQ